MNVLNQTMRGKMKPRSKTKELLLTALASVAFFAAVIVSMIVW